ncbi:MAG: hypothetical protein GY834_08050 [Bacteroidetes bacterium]|nr:hypothetical protein [Bacteroidota bacterium]
MKENLVKITIGIFMILLANDITAQFNFSGEFRPRAEYRHGYKTLSVTDADAAFFISQRTRLNAYYSAPDFKTGFSLQDVRIWGDVKQLNTTDDHLFIHEAWGQYFFSENFSMKLGRQEIIYDDHRIFGSVNWAQQARSHDVAIFKFLEGKFKFDVGLAFNQLKENNFGTLYTLNNYKSFQYLWAHQNVKNLGISFLFLNNGMQYATLANSDPYDIAYSQTVGTRLTYKNSGLNINTALYLQGGQNAANVDLSASYFAGEIIYAFSKEFKANVGFELLSGNDYDDIGNNLEDKAFAPLYGTNHKFNGHMDYFYVGSHFGEVGLQDIFIGLNYAKDKVKLGLTTHIFSSAGEINNMSESLGTEFDLSFGYAFSKGASMSIGYSQMFGTDTMEMIKGGDSEESNSWAYVMFVFKPQFLQ